MVEELKKEDLNSYKELMEKVFSSSFSVDNYNPGNYQVLVIKEDDKVVAALSYYKIDLFTRRMLEIFNLGVDPDYRGRSLAEKLFDHLIKYAKDNSYKSIYVNCSSDAYGAHKLYEKMGLKRQNTLKFELSLEDANDACRINWEIS